MSGDWCEASLRVLDSSCGAEAGAELSDNVSTDDADVVIVVKPPESNGLRDDIFVRLKRKRRAEMRRIGNEIAVVQL